jgi:hypothetical protein
MTITGYKYTTEAEAQAAVQSCNTHYGIPKSPDSVTQTWCNYNTAELDSPVFYYITHDSSLNVVLGEPTEFEVTVPDMEA